MIVSQTITVNGYRFKHRVNACFDPVCIEGQFGLNTRHKGHEGHENKAKFCCRLFGNLNNLFFNGLNVFLRGLCVLRAIVLKTNSPACKKTHPHKNKQDRQQQSQPLFFSVPSSDFRNQVNQYQR
jgi:hypothetical protein